MKTPKPVKYLGIWLDHSTAYFNEYTKDSMQAETVESTFTHHDKEEKSNSNENVMHNKEQQTQRAFYTELMEVIKKYDEVLLFGPTDAKSELSNLLKSDHHFDKINVGIESAEKMTENQQHAFVRGYFQNMNSHEKAS